MKYTSILFSLLLLIGGSLVAESPTPDEVTSEAITEVEAQTAAEDAVRDAAVVRYERFQHAIDLWHDANLKGDKDLIGKYRNQLFLLMDHDIEASRLALSGTAVKVSAPAYGPKLDRESNYLGVYSRPTSEFETKQTEILARRRLAESARKSEAFSNRFRLFNDYLDLMKRSAEPAKVELVEGGDQDPIK